MYNTTWSIKIAKILSMISIIIPLGTCIIIVAGIFNIKIYQATGAIPFRQGSFICLIGIILAFISKKIYPNKLSGLSKIINVVLMVLFLIPSVYWYGGTFVEFILKSISK